MIIARSAINRRRASRFAARVDLFVLGAGAAIVVGLLGMGIGGFLSPGANLTVFSLLFAPVYFSGTLSMFLIILLVVVMRVARMLSIPVSRDK